MNWVRHGGSTTFETKSSYCRVARQGLPSHTAVARLGFKRRATAVRGKVEQLSSARQYHYVWNWPQIRNTHLRLFRPDQGPHTVYIEIKISCVCQLQSLTIISDSNQVFIILHEPFLLSFRQSKIYGDRSLEWITRYFTKEQQKQEKRELKVLQISKHLAEY